MIDQVSRTGEWPNAAAAHTDGDVAWPLQITPGTIGNDLVAWIAGNDSLFNQQLVRHGAILFRGFNINTVERFNQLMQCFNTDPLPYMFRSSPREELDNKVKHIYRSTSYPSDRSINMHNESSYSRVWGMKIVFCCLQPAEEGGETPLADSRKVLQHIDPGIVEKFKETGVKYRRNLSAGLGMPWQEVFQTDKQEKVKTVCEKNNIWYEFRGDDLVIEWTKPAVYNHPVSGEPTWFNHVLFFNRFARYEELDLEPGDFLPAEYLSSETFYGDGSAITYEEYRHIKNAYAANTVALPYQQGDVFFLDNMLTAHGRNPYKGNRTIATAILEAAYDSSYTL